MKSKKIHKMIKITVQTFSFSLAFLLFNIIIFCGKVEHDHPNSIYLFLLDTSLSMGEEQGLHFNHVKTFLIKRIQKSKPGDQIIVFTFDESIVQVLNVTLSNELYKKKVIEEVKSLRLKGQWTWIRKAIEQLNRTIRSLKKKYPEHLMEIYLLTDGKDDPPPQYGESKISFEELVNKQFGLYRKEDTHIYILDFESEPISPVHKKHLKEEKIVRLQEEKGHEYRQEQKKKKTIQSPKNKSPDDKPGHLEKKIVRSLDEKVLERQSDIKEKVIVRLLEITSHKQKPELAEEKIVELPEEKIHEHKPGLKEMEIDRLSKEKKPKSKPNLKGRETDPLLKEKIPEDKPDIKEIEIDQSSEKVMVTPEKITIDMNIHSIEPQIKSEPKPSLFKVISNTGIFTIRNLVIFMISLSLILLLIFFAKWMIFPKMTVWVEGEMIGRAIPVTVNKWRKTFLDECGIPNYYLIMDRFRMIIYIGETINNTIRFLKDGKTISCLLPSGKRRYIIFHFSTLSSTS